MTTPDAAAQRRRELEAELAALDKEIRANERLLAIRKAKDSLEDFIRILMPDPEAPDDVSRSRYSVQPHHRYLIQAMEKVERRELMRFGNSIPPQNGKSLICSKMAVAWILGRNPHWHIIVGTYASDLAERIGSEVREILNNPTFQAIFPACKLKHGSRAKDEMETTAGGSLVFVGRGKATTGRTCDLFIIDDPFKDKAEADSAAIRQDVWEWYSAVVFSRCRITTPIVIFHTRWHEADLLGEILDRDKGKGRWRYVNIPAIMDDPELAHALGKRVGDPLWPERFPLSLLEEARENDPLIFSALYLGRPSPETGDYFKREWLREYEPHELPRDLRYWAAMDLAVSADSKRDASVVITAGVDHEDNIWIVDCLHARLEADDLIDAVLDKFEEYEPQAVFSEKGVIAKSIGPFLRKRMEERDVFVVLEEMAATKDKQARAQSIRGRMAQGKVRFPKSAPWWPVLRDELLKFPQGAHDDGVDALAWLGIGIKRQFGGRAPDDGAAKGPAWGTGAWLKKAIRRNRIRDKIDKAVAGY